MVPRRHERVTQAGRYEHRYLSKARCQAAERVLDLVFISIEFACCIMGDTCTSLRDAYSR